MLPIPIAARRGRYPIRTTGRHGSSAQLSSDATAFKEVDRKSVALVRSGAVRPVNLGQTRTTAVKIKNRYGQVTGHFHAQSRRVPLAFQSWPCRFDPGHPLHDPADSLPRDLAHAQFGPPMLIDSSTADSWDRSSAVAAGVVFSSITSRFLLSSIAVNDTLSPAFSPNSCPSGSVMTRSPAPLQPFGGAVRVTC